MTDRSPEPHEPGDDGFWGGPLAGPLTYLIVLALYVAIGMYFHPLLSWTRGFIFPLVGIWLVPHLYRRWRGK